MRFSGLALGLIFTATSLAAPVKQHPLGSHHSTPFTPEHRDPYDRKVDSVGRKLQPLPYVSLPDLDLLARLLRLII